MANLANGISLQGLGDCTADARPSTGSGRGEPVEPRRTRSEEFLIKKHSELCELCGHEKKLKNDEIRKIGINKIKYLQVLILAKIDFFSRPVPLW